MSEHHIIYIPGLGDPYRPEQFVVEKIWRVHKVTAHYHPIYWSDKNTFEPKLSAILKQIDELTAAGHKVSLVGTSAGASTAIDAFAKRSSTVSGVVCICGKLRNLEKIAESFYTKNPSFRGSIELLPDSLTSLGKINRQKIMSIRPILDGVVPVGDTYIDDAKPKIIPTVGHVFSIFYSLTFGSRSITKFLKSQSS